jgi:hypothetical protein
MGIKLVAQNLLSRRARRSSAGESGIRRLNFNNSITNQTRDGNIIGRVLNFGGKIINGLSSVVSWSKLTAVNTWEWVVNAIERIREFDWNQTDYDLMQRIENQSVNVASAWGEVAGSVEGTLGAALIGAGIGFVLPVIGGGAVAGLIAYNVLNENFDEILSNLFNAIRTSMGAYVRSQAIKYYINLRRWVKSWDIKALTFLFGEDNAKWIKKKWGNEGGIDQSFNARRDRKLEKIKSKELRAFQESRWDARWDSFVEGGMVVAETIDSQYQMVQLANQNSLGEQRNVELTFDTNAPEETANFIGREEIIVPQISNAVAQHQLIRNRDVGYIGSLDPEGIWLPEFQKQRLTIIFYSIEKPPFRNPDGTRPIRAEYNVPSPKRSLTWDVIKRACGKQGYMWGEFYAHGRFDNRRKMIVYGQSELEAVNQLESLADLSEANITSISTGRMKERRTNSGRIKGKRPTRVYPVFMYATKRRLTTVEEGRINAEGQTWTEQREKILLWTETAPPNGGNIFGG